MPYAPCQNCGKPKHRSLFCRFCGFSTEEDEATLEQRVKQQQIDAYFKRKKEEEKARKAVLSEYYRSEHYNDGQNSQAEFHNYQAICRIVERRTTPILGFGVLSPTATNHEGKFGTPSDRTIYSPDNKINHDWKHNS